MLFSRRSRRPVALLLSGTLTLVSGLPAAPVYSAVSRPTRAPDGPPDVYAITNAKIVPVNGKPLDKGTIVFRDGIILEIGEKVSLPADAQVIDGTGLTLYPALVNAYSRLGMPAPTDYPTGRGDGYPVSTVRAENNAISLMKPDPTAAGALRRVGFGAALVAPYVGLFSGTSAVVTLTDDPNPAALTVRTPVAMQMAFFAPNVERGYPNSLMGYVAVMRQALYDAQGASARLSEYAKNPAGKPRPAVTHAVSALIPVVDKKLPLMVAASSAPDIQRILRLSAEFGLKPIIEGGAEAYNAVDDLKKANVPVLLTANLPQAPRTTPGSEDRTTLQGLRNRALAPTTAARLAKAGVTFALTTDGMENPSDFTRNVRKMIAAGLTEEQALVATTLTPAKILGVDAQLGSLEQGKIANVLAVEGGTLFDGKGKIKYLFVDGKKQVMDTSAGGNTPGGGGAPGGAAALLRNLPPGVSREQAIEFLRRNPQQAAQFLPQGVTPEQAIAALEGQTPGGGAGNTPAATPDDVTAPPAVGEGLIPPLPPQMSSSFVLRGATVWTSGPQGKLDNADVYVKDGKIEAVGAGLKVPGGTTEVDAKGKHITPGMIDCHSHTAIDRGINEGTNIVTAECRIRDVIDPEDNNIYRQLAGGTTTANVLHGSANAIGGQNAVLKWRWGASAEEMIFQGAPQGIKFALGENPTRSNGGIPTTGERRYPATRMGVERVIRAKFMEAHDYEAQMDAYKQGRIPVAPRRNLQLDAIVEILNGTRLVHCHSYRADEILMMMRVADEYGFHVATFQHVLEGYKVADEMAKHGAGGSTFSDWWGFKIEAIDAIPYNAALMTDRGVVCSLNSDDDDLARRLNYEAAKAVRYGGMKPEEALKLVTINPAKQLRIDKKVGSLEPGKDADIAVWSTSPLSTMAICEKTFVDGKLYFDRAEDLKARPVLDAEKKRLQAALNPQPAGGRRGGPGGPGGAPGQPGAGQPDGGTTPPSPSRVNGPRLSTDASAENRPEPPNTGPITAIVGATVHPVSGPDIPNGVVLIQGGKIKAVGAAGSVTVPGDATKVDATGKHVFPGMIDANTSIAVNEIESRRETQDFSELGDFKPELRVSVVINPDSDVLHVTRSSGILNALVNPTGGIIAGMSALTQLDGWTSEEIAIVPNAGLLLNFPSQGGRRFREAGHHCEETATNGDFDLSSDAGFASGMDIPATSYDRAALRYGQPPAPTVTVTPGAPGAPGGGRPGQRPGGFGGRGQGAGGAGRPDPEAVLKPLNDFLEEARTYKNARAASGKVGVPPMTRDPRLEGMLPVLDGKVPLLVQVNRASDIRSAVAWAKKQNMKMVVVGGAEADDVADLLVKENIPVILTGILKLPDEADAAYDDSYTLPTRLAKAGVKFCISSGDSTHARRLPQHAAMAAAFGLPADEALKAITLYPAQILGAGDRLGSIEPGKDANLIITTDNPLEITGDVQAAYVAGHPVDLTNRQQRQYEHWKSRPKK